MTRSRASSTPPSSTRSRSACRPKRPTTWTPISRLAADEGKTVRIPIDPLAGALPNAREEEFEGFLVRSLVHDAERELGLMLKRLIDIGGAAVGLVVLSPLPPRASPS